MARRYPASEKSTNFACLCRINIDVFRDVFWEIVIQYIPASDLVRRLQGFLPQELTLPFHFQLHLLCKLGRDLERSDCDTSALYHIIRNLCPLPPPPTGWGQPPHLAAISMADDVESIRQEHNKLRHHSTIASVTDKDFQSVLQKYRTILNRFDGILDTSFSHQLEAVVEESREPASADLYRRYVAEMLDQKQKDEGLPENVRSMNTEVRSMNTEVRSMNTEVRSMDTDVESMDTDEDGRLNVASSSPEGSCPSVSATVASVNANVQQDQSQMDGQEHSVHQEVTSLEHEHWEQQTDDLMEPEEQQLKPMSSRRHASKQNMRDMLSRQQIAKQNMEQANRQKTVASPVKGSSSTASSHVLAGYNRFERQREHRAPQRVEPEFTPDYVAELVNVYQELLSTLPQLKGCLGVDVLQLFTPVQIRESGVHEQASCRLHGLNDEEEKLPPCSEDLLPTYRDVFYRNGCLEQSIFLLGDSGSGKTAFCYHLVNLWCKIQNKEPSLSSYSDQALISVLKEFRILYFIRCVDYNTNTLDPSQRPFMSIYRMIKQSYSFGNTEEALRQLFRGCIKKTLVLIDGLDEWVYTSTEESHTLSPDGIPDCKDVFGSAVLITSRPWRIEALNNSLGPSHRILKLDGLDRGGVHDLTCKILQRHSMVKEDSQVQMIFNKFHQQLEKDNVEDLVRHPLRLYITLQSWLSGESTLRRDNVLSCTAFIEAVLNYSEDRVKEQIILETQWRTRSNKYDNKEINPSDLRLPACFEGRILCSKYRTQIRNMASLAFNRLMKEDREETLILTKRELYEKVGQTDLTLCEKLGIISEIKTSPRSYRYQKYVAISFPHESVHEFFAAMHLSEDTTGTCLTEFKERLTSLSDVFDASNFIVLLYRMSPVKGQLVLKHAFDVLEQCPEIETYRKLAHKELYPAEEDLEALIRFVQQLCMRCVVEPELGGKFPTHRHGYCVPDVLIDQETPSGTIQQLCCPGAHIKSVVFKDDVETPLDFVKALNKKLKQIEKMHINVPRGKESKYLEQLCQSLSSLGQLKAFGLYAQSVYSLSSELAATFFGKLGRLPSIASLSLGRLDLTSLEVCRFPKSLTSLHLYWMSVPSDLVIPSSCDTVYLRDVAFTGKLILSPTCTRLRLHMMSVSELSTFPASLTSLEIMYVTMATTAVQQVCGGLQSTSALQFLDLSPWPQVSLREPLNVSSHMSLHTLVLRHIELDGCGIVVPRNLREVQMVGVSMSNRFWKQLVCCLSIVTQVTVGLGCVRTLDKTTVKYIYTHFNITQNQAEEDDRRTIHFKTKQ